MEMKFIIDEYKKRHPQGDFFNETRLSMTGESVETMRVLAARSLLELPDGQGGVKFHSCVCICSPQKISNDLRGKSAYHYLDLNTFDWVMTKR